MDEPSLPAIIEQLEAAAAERVCYACEVKGGHADDCPIKIMHEITDRAMDRMMWEHVARASALTGERMDSMIAELSAMAKDYGTLAVLTPIRPTLHPARYSPMDGVEIIHMEMSPRDVEARLVHALGDMSVITLDSLPELHMVKAREPMALPDVYYFDLSIPKTHPRSPKETMRANRPKRAKRGKKGKRR